MFSKDSKAKEFVRENTQSGQIVFNDVMLQGGVPKLPFGGTGGSGYGYHMGRDAFNTFTYLRSSIDSPSWLDILLKVRYPPYSESRLKKALFFLQKPIWYSRPGAPQSSSGLKNLVRCLGAGFVVMLAAYLVRRLKDSRLK